MRTFSIIALAAMLPLVKSGDFLDDCANGCDVSVKAGNETISIFLGTNQSVYRFGDVVTGRGIRWERCVSFVVEQYLRVSE